MNLLLDTNTCVDALKGHPQVLSRLSTVSPADCAVSAVTAFELFNGVRRSAHPDRETTKLRKFFAVVAILPFDREAAWRAAELRLALERRGAKIGPYDLLIAGHALGTGRMLVTNNTREFSRVDGLSLEDWRL